MRHLAAVLLVFACSAIVSAQGLVTAGEALDKKTCRELAEQVKARIEAYTRMKFRRSVPIRVQPRAVWEARLKQQGYGGMTARSGLAFYNIVANNVTVVPWTIGGYLNTKSPPRRSADEWLGKLEPIMVHELTHAIHHQNFFVVLGGARQASLKKDGLTEDEKDISTVEFLSAEGYAELVAHRTASRVGRSYLLRFPHDELSHPRSYLRKYQPDGKRAFRSILSQHGYVDGIDLLNKLTLRAGPRGVRAILYRPPPRPLFFQPELLATVDLDDPPEPDAILGFLAPFLLKGGEVHLTVNPGPGRYFLSARSHPGSDVRAPGCLVGFAAEVGEDDGPNGAGRYAYYVADPDKPGKWSAEQAATLKALHPPGVKESRRLVPGTKVKASLITVTSEDGEYVRAESEGLVVIAHESKPTKYLEKRVLGALGYLYLYKPKPNVYRKAVDEAMRRIKAKD